MEINVSVTFEARRLYVAPRKSVLFFARVGDQRVRCYVQQDALIEPTRAQREEADVYQRCLLAYDHHRDLIQAAASRLIEARVGGLDGVVVVSSAALALQAEASVAALASAR
jgi:Protein of unknown function (DUF1488)